MWAFYFAIEFFLHILSSDEFEVRYHATLALFDSCLCVYCLCEDTATKIEILPMKEYSAGHS